MVLQPFPVTSVIHSCMTEAAGVPACLSVQEETGEDSMGA